MIPAQWLERRVLVCVGTGGVGKTTVSAAIALEGARRGLRALVLTIDPARRLSDALGIGPLGPEPRRVPRKALLSAGIDSDGSLDAMMLDPKRTFDELVERYAPDARTKEEIYANPIYQNLTDALGGSREYSAMEQLHQLHQAGSYDLIVVDTPPARHALEFLDAPRRLIGFLDSKVLRLLFGPALAMGRTGFRLFRLGSATVLRTIERISGLEFIRMISEFLLVFEGMLEGFVQRARETERLLRSQDCGFVLVAGPDPAQARLATSFTQRLSSEGIELLGLIANRARTWPGGSEVPELDEAACREATSALEHALGQEETPFEPDRVAEVLVETASRQALLARQDRETLATLIEELPLGPEQTRTIPLLSEDVHALEALARMARFVFPESSDVA